jgi:cytoskeletal protein CcmA (bactofilin family)
MSKKDQYFTQISPSTQITGEVVVENDIRIGGKLTGKVKTSGDLVLESTGTVEGDLEVQSATIVGKVVGNIVCKERLILESKSLVQGDILTKELVIIEGSRFEGNCKMGVKAPNEVK